MSAEHYLHPEAAVRALIAEAEVRGAVRALDAAAEEIEAQMVCCDVYDRLRDKPSAEWSDDEKADYRRHAICYWSAASRSLVLARIEATR